MQIDVSCGAERFHGGSQLAHLATQELDVRQRLRELRLDNGRALLRGRSSGPLEQAAGRGVQSELRIRKNVKAVDELTRWPASKPGPMRRDKPLES